MGKANNSFEIMAKISKVDAEKRMVFGWASIVEKDGIIQIDAHDDTISVDELEKMAYDYVVECRNGGEMHETIGVSTMIESMVFTKDKQEQMGIDLGMTGWWVGFKIHDDGVWEGVKSGKYSAFSIGGSGKRVKA